MDFILVKDALFASEARHALAKNNTVGTRVGSFQVLLEALAELWVLPQPSEKWEDTLHEQALSMDQAFWAKSMQADELATLQSLGSSLQFLLDYKPLGTEFEIINDVKNRQQRYYNDLVALQQAIKILPVQQQLAEDWLAVCSGPVLEPIHIYLQLDPKELLPWQQSVLNQLEEKGWLQPEPEKYADIFPILQSGSEAIRNLSERLFKPVDTPLSQPDESLQWFTCRDAAEEAEAAVALIQSAIEQGLSAEDIAVVIPKGPKGTAHGEWLNRYLQKAGIQSSNLRPGNNLLDWQAALLQNLVSYLAQPTVRMAMQSVLVNPLMPWAPVVGQRLASKYQGYQTLSSQQQEQQDMLDILFGTEEHPLVINTAEQALEWLTSIANNVSYKGVIGLGKKRMREQLQQLKRLLNLYAEQPFEQQLSKVLKQLRVGALAVNSERQRYLHAVLVLEEGEVPPKPLQQIIALGFNSGHYEYRTPNTGAITWQEWSGDKLRPEVPALANIPSLHEEQQQWQRHFVSLLSAAKQRFVFIRSLTDFEGNLLDASETLIDMALCYCPKDQIKPESLERPISECQQINWQPLTPNKTIVLDIPEQLELKTSQKLMGSFHNSDGSVRLESPSSLERMMLSPLAWLLNRLRIESALWETDALKPHIAGTIAHQVFEDYADFQDEKWNESKVRECLNSAINQYAPFLDRQAFALAKQQLANEVVKSLEALHEWRQQTDENNEHWRIVATEKTLTGTEFGVGLKGSTDAVLQKGDDVLILDYKKSQHKSRLIQLKSGYELQTRLYRSLYKQTIKADTGADVAGIVTSGYYTLNDQVLVTDVELHDSPKVHVKNADDVSLAEQSSKAEESVKAALAQLNTGTVKLNRTTDAKEWKNKRGLSVYTLTENRLVQRFTTDKEVTQ